MITMIKKRDGREAPFNIEKIARAIYRAAEAVGGNDYSEAMELADTVCQQLSESIIGRNPSVEEVQDMVERVLIENGHAKTAKAYILYRAERTRAREMNTTLMKIYEDLTFKSAGEYDLKRENANIDGDTAMGTMLKYGSEGAKQFNELYVLDPVHSNAHINGDIHIHDLDFLTLTTTCCQIDLLKLFHDGFSTGHGFLREPNDIASYAALACIAIQSNQNDQHGGQSVPNFDYAMAEGVKKTFKRLYHKNLAKALLYTYDSRDFAAIENKIREAADKIEADFGLVPQLHNNDEYKSKEWDLLASEYGDKFSALQDEAETLAEAETDRATYQAMEALIHNLNTMNSRAGAQNPFSSINYGTDTSPEGRMVSFNVMKAEEAGLGNGETPIFPIHIFKVKDGVNFSEGDPNYDLFKLAMRVSAKRMFPNFSFIDAPFNLQYYKEGDYHTEIAYMGCRTRVIGNNHDKSREIVTGRGNLSFTTINLPRLGIEAHGDIEKFYKSLDKTMDIVFDQLYQRLLIQSRKHVRNYPFLMGQGVWIDSEKLSENDSIAEILKHGSLSTGFIGLAETLVALTGKHHGESEESQKLGLEIITHMRERADEKGRETGLNYTLLATPAEGLSGRFISIDKKRYGEIPGVTDKDFYTNSFHIPVYYNISAFRKIKLEAPYHALTNGGHISYVELDGDPLKNLDAFEKVVRYMKEQGIGYGAINHPIDRDPCCGFTGIIDDECPNCHRREGEVIEDRIERPKLFTSDN
ncbi:MAG TPA: anaerobic ribonucleoside triphosphate reductase [Ruminococcaceae bacterium]|nr:anaerobic ribonucleoside triphosphate reductase [Oscillospiraceae bacterium]